MSSPQLALASIPSPHLQDIHLASSMATTNGGEDRVARWTGKRARHNTHKASRLLGDAGSIGVDTSRMYLPKRVADALGAIPPVGSTDADPVDA
ncbi:hypothetical protein DFH11DRAFT_1731288 [Phellopilus nigrolimitatus]|nr:hypothetical protein DFH11DRAFT_1731288 [Phellopilus nigrolimitatus]